jgi:transposase
MAKSLSVDLRSRVVAAIEGGLSRRRAAERFGVSPSSAIRWHAQYRSTGAVAPRRQGGDRRSGRAEAEAALILDRVAAAPDLTLAELQAELKAGRGVWLGIGTLWRLFRRRGITLKKRRRMRASSSVPT